MGSSDNLPGAAPPVEFINRFRTEAGSNGVMSFESFMKLALYDEELGYYRKAKSRIGYGKESDFYTATTSGSLFGELIAAAVTEIIGTKMASKCTFVEIGCEPTGGVMANVVHPFSATSTIQLGEAMELDGMCVVFSNELFDAQPCRRFIFKTGIWRELGVGCADDRLFEVELPLGDTQPYLPSDVAEGYILDAPQAAVSLLHVILNQPWHGLFIAIDYGKPWEELIRATPQGTVIAYFRHAQSNDLLAHPGGQDLTCHVCWDWLSAALTRHEFSGPILESQESFFIHHAASLLQDVTTSEAKHLSRRKLALTQLIHPSYLGQKFQVLHAIRSAP